jgi:hypothetical protein
MTQSRAMLSSIRRLLLFAVVGFVLWLGAYNWLTLGDAGDAVKGVVFALILVSGDLIRASQTLRTRMKALSSLRARTNDWHKPGMTQA